MENNYPYPPYPESGDSSPEIDFDNPPPWEDPNQNQSNNTYKVKFMCSYNGKIQPRPHDNQLSYIGGETKILTVDRNVKFNTLVAKINNLCNSHVCFKYQLPGEDLDALISVTDDEDLEHMMHEYDRLCKPNSKPARLRLFLFNVNPITPPPSVDLLIELEKPKDVPVPESEKCMEDLQNLKIGEEQAMYRRKSDDNLVAAFSDTFVSKPEKVAPVTNYWPENQMSNVYPVATRDQQVYMVPPRGGVYHAPMGYYPVYAQSGVPQPQMVMPRTTGRQVYYGAPGGRVAQVGQPVQYQGMGGTVGYSADMRPAGNFIQEGGKVVSEATM